MAVIETTIAIASLARLVQPLAKDIYNGAKKAGVRGFNKWEQTTFPTKLAKRLAVIEKVRTIWKPGESISLRDFFHPPKLLVDGKPTRISRIAEISNNAVVIQGIVGQGKSVLMRSLAIEELLSNDAKWLPIFIELKDLSPKLSLNAAILKHLDGYDIELDDESLSYLYRSGKCALLLDGFDELDETLVKETYLEIEHLTRKYTELRILISCRPGHEIQKSTAFTTLKIAPLTEPEYPAFLDRLKVDSKKSIELRQAIRNSPSKISSLIVTPLMLTLVVMVYESESQIPETLPEFFEGLFQFVFTRHDRQKANFNRKHHCGLSEKRLQQLFETFSFITLQLDHGRTLTQKQFDDVFEQALAYSEGLECECEKFKLDITKVACLMLEDGVDSITYLHKSILEYYAAAFVKRLSDENAEHFYKAISEKSRAWEEVLVFLRAIDSVRYSKYYIIPFIEQQKTEILTPADGAGDKEIVSLVVSLYPGLGAYYKKEESGYALSAIGSMARRPGEEIGSLGFLLLDTVHDIAPTRVEDLHEAYGGNALEIDEELGHHVPLALLLKYSGTKEVRSALGIFSSRIEQAESAARSIVASEEKKKQMFIKPTSKQV